MNFITKNPDTSRYLRLGYIAFALIIAVLYDLFFWKQETGIAFPLFVVVYLAGFLLITTLTNQFRQRWPLLLLLPIAVLSIDTILYNNELVSFLGTKVVFLLSVVFSLVSTLANPHGHPFLFRQIPLLHSIDLPFTKWSQMYKDLLRWNGATDKDTARKVAIGLVISLPILFIFTILFMQADAVFSQWLDKVFNITDVISLEGLWRVVRVLILTVFIGSFFYCIFSDSHELGHKEYSVFKFDRIITGIVLGLVNILFLMFVAIQFKYMFGSASFVLENGLGYAEYARKGFFELAWVVALAALLVIVVYRSFVRHGISKIITALQVLLVAQVGVVAVSALKRMYLYQDAYGFTVLRLYVEWAIYLILLVLAFTIISLLFKISFRKFWYANLIVGVVAFTMVATINVDKMIAKENIDRFLQQGKELDLQYLDQLSTDILPVFHQLLNQENIKKFTAQDQLYIKDIFKKKTETVAKRDNWREWHAGDFSNKYFTVPPEPEYYARMNALEAKNIEYEALEQQVHFQDVTCSRYAGVSLKGTGSCYFAGRDPKKAYVYVLDMEQINKNTNSTLEADYQTTFSLYERIVSTTTPIRHIPIFSKTLPLLTHKQADGDISYESRYVFHTDGRVLERVPEELKHNAYTVVFTNNQFNLVKTERIVK